MSNLQYTFPLHSYSFVTVRPTEDNFGGYLWPEKMMNTIFQPERRNALLPARSNGISYSSQQWKIPYQHTSHKETTKKTKGFCLVTSNRVTIQQPP
ncbi:hypothetical protein JTE90_014897 [Oedothorax gibbosus]|uniref:Uncharacterized protein n=1 Tax=Oedothorax gibbosus TaxID=931172 RepID=A0AAV6VPF9_9ARAC|nr:hypothetical protein JTE90_014897 [Oedothorax gibbosus]